MMLQLHLIVVVAARIWLHGYLASSINQFLDRNETNKYLSSKQQQYKDSYRASDVFFFSLLSLSLLVFIIGPYSVCVCVCKVCFNLAPLAFLPGSKSQVG